MKHSLSALLLGIGLITPVAMRADHDDHRAHRYYDRDARDWHEWNDREDRAYRQYLNEQHREYRDMAKANRKEQREYWRWRTNIPIPTANVPRPCSGRVRLLQGGYPDCLKREPRGQSDIPGVAFVDLRGIVK